MFAGSLVVVGAILGLTGSFSIGLFVFLAAVLFAVATYLVSRFVEGRRKATDRLVTVVVTSGVPDRPGPADLGGRSRSSATGWPASTSSSSPPRCAASSATGGGGYHAIVGTLIITGLAALMSIPVGLLTAIYLVEYGTGRLARAITFFVDVMTGIPSIVAGLFAFALFALFFGPGVRMGFGGAVALSVLMIPVVVRATEEMLQDRAERAARGRLRAGHARSGGPSSRSSSRPRSPASPPASRWPSPG